MNTEQLICFLAAADSLSFAKAARQLHVTQPAVTYQIKNLEAELGVLLFVRTTRCVTLTRAGQIFLEDARRILDLEEAAKSRVACPECTLVSTE
jgi:DNA-binding transcriptional LysR family regulator